MRYLRTCNLGRLSGASGIGGNMVFSRGIGVFFPRLIWTTIDTSEGVESISFRGPRYDKSHETQRPSVSDGRSLLVVVSPYLSSATTKSK